MMCFPATVIGGCLALRANRRVRRFGIAVDGVGAIRPPSWLYCRVAAIRPTGGTVPGEFGGAGVQRDRRRPVPCLGLAHSVLPEHHPGRDRALYQARHLRNPDLFAAGCGKPDREGAGARSHQTAAQADHPNRVGADGVADAVLHLHRFSSLPIERRSLGFRAICC